MTCNERPIFLGDLELPRFTCNPSFKIEPSVATDDTIDGTGSTLNPLSINNVALCAVLDECTINDLGDVDLPTQTLSYNEMLVVDTVSGEVQSLDMTAAIDCSYFTGI